MPDPLKPDDGERLVLTTPRRRIVWGLILFAAAMALGLWVTGMSDDSVFAAWSWVGVLALGAAVVVSLLNLRRPPQLILTSEGFTVTGPFGVGPIPWRDVERFSIYREPAGADDAGGPPYASWTLKPTSPHRGGVASRLHRAGDMPIDGALPARIGPPLQELVDLMESWRTRYG